MSGIMEQLEGSVVSTNTRLAFLVQSAVGQELNPKRNRIIVQAHESDIGLIKLWRIQFRSRARQRLPLSKHASPEKRCEVLILLENVGLFPYANLIINVKQCSQ